MLTRAWLAVLAMTAPAAAFELGLPIDCTIGINCFVQHYVDLDPGPGVRDYACGTASYDRHDGIDIRVRTTADAAKGVAVIAAAEGVVKGVRDGVPDRLVRGPQERAAVKDRECGNGVLIDHGAGYETQYCHLREGSVQVRKGQAVRAGQRLGDVGYSGLAGFPHVHLTARKDGKALDPFRPDGDSRACAIAADALWDQTARGALPYAGGDLMVLGFADAPVELPALETGSVPALSPEAPALLAYAWAINLRAGDRLSVELSEPQGTLLADQVTTLERNQAQYMLFAGKKRPAQGWPPGAYLARFTLERAGKTMIDRTSALTIP